MKKFLLTIGLATAVLTSSFAQDRNFSISYTINANDWRPVPTVSYPVTRLNNFVGVGSLDVLGFAGYNPSNTAPTAGVGLVRRFRLADNLNAYFGVQGSFVQGRPVSGGLMVGIELLRF